ncbi:Fibroblast growth factor receptor 1 [Fasciola hepatica]|uniref:Fibroblast growth factor receptor 1 n=1 Tax=Fasciola hepatica TaxID=6192 RepID=A0A4E0S3K6_FASHE|nr:Fibroblast growth factor receptor 1 [Fasciola hepatica]
MYHSETMLLMWCICALSSYDRTNAETNVPVVANHNKQIRLDIGGHLRLECPVHSTPSGRLISAGEPLVPESNADYGSPVLYHWQVRDRLDYSLDSDPRYRFNDNRRVLEVIVPLELSDSGTYTCMGVTGFGKREVTFDVHVRDPSANLLCAEQSQLHQNVKAPCFIDSKLKHSPVITIEQPVGSTVRLSCESEGTEPIKYRWFMGNTVADWITTSQGARGPILTIDHVGREHTGHYTCQVSNLGGSLNYTYRLVVTELPSATPKIVSDARNQTFQSDSNAALTARIKCACDEPVIQWLKRVEPGEEDKYEKAGATKISLPNARQSEINEMFVVLGSWTGSPAVIDKTVVKRTEEVGSDTTLVQGSEQASKPTLYYGPKPSGTAQIFITRMHLQKPLEKDKHGGKYVVMTMSLSDIKSMEYAVMYVDILQDPNFLKGRRILIYFLIPFCLLFAVLGLIAYIFICRRRTSSGNSLSSSNERCILRTTEISPQAYQISMNGKKPSSLNASSRHSSHSQNTGKQAYSLLGVQSPLFHSEIRPNATTNGFDQQVTAPNPPANMGYYAVGISPFQANSVTSINSNMQLMANGNPIQTTNSTVLSSNGSYVTAAHPSQRNVVYGQQVPVTNMCPAGCDYTQGSAQKTTFFQPGSAAPSSKCEGSIAGIPYPMAQFPNNAATPMMNVAMNQINSNDVSFDQYSAVSQSPLSSSTLTNHYTAPFGEYVRGCLPDGMEQAGTNHSGFSQT